MGRFSLQLRLRNDTVQRRAVHEKKHKIIAPLCSLIISPRFRFFTFFFSSLRVTRKLGRCLAVARVRSPRTTRMQPQGLEEVGLKNGVFILGNCIRILFCGKQRDKRDTHHCCRKAVVLHYQIKVGVPFDRTVIWIQLVKNKTGATPLPPPWQRTRQLIESNCTDGLMEREIITIGSWNSKSKKKRKERKRRIHTLRENKDERET